MRQDLSSAQILDLLHHWRRDRYVINTANTCQALFFRSLFSSVDVVGLENVISRAKAGQTLVFIPNHQSEYDWMMLQTYLARRYVRTAIQAGENLFVGPVDSFLRKCGAFMMIRDRRAFYGKHWFGNFANKLLGTRPLVITKEQYNRLYLEQIKMVLREKLHLMIFPGYETSPTGDVKYGRSYSGEFAELSAYVFLVVNTAVRQIEIDNAFFVPVNISYERVPEDIVFREYQAKTRKTKIAKYVYDYYYTFIKAPITRRMREQRCRVCVRFGEGVPADGSLRAREQARVVRHEMGKLTRVYESTLLFASLDDHFRVSRSELEKRIAQNLDRLEEHGMDTSPMYLHGRRLSLDAILERTARLFNYPRAPVIASKAYTTLEYDDDNVFVRHPHLAAYYGNKLRHALQERPSTGEAA